MGMRRNKHLGKERPGLSRLIGLRASRFAEETDGVSIVEFALMFPLLVLVLMMTITTSHMMMIDRKVTFAAQAAADLIAQRQAVDSVAITEIQRASELMMRPFAANFDISVAHVPFESPGGAPSMSNAAAWRALINAGAVQITDAEAEAAADGSSNSAPASALPHEFARPLGDPGDALIVLRMNYQYQSLWGGDFSFLGLTFPGTMTFTKSTFARPRLNNQIEASNTLISVM